MSTEIATDVPATETTQDVAANQPSLTPAAPTHSWRDALPVDLRSNEFIKDKTKPAEVVSEYIKLKQMTLDVPSDPDGYELKPSVELPPEFSKPEMLSEYSKLAHNLKLTKGQATKLSEWYYNKLNEQVTENSRVSETNEAQAIEELRKEWTGDTFDKNKALAVQTFKKFSSPEALELVENARVNGVRLGNHPAFLKLFSNIGNLTSQDGAASFKDAQSTSVQSAEEIALKMFPSMRKREN